MSVCDNCQPTPIVPASDSSGSGSVVLTVSTISTHWQCLEAANTKEQHTIVCCVALRVGLRATQNVDIHKVQPVVATAGSHWHCQCALPVLVVAVAHVGKGKSETVTLVSQALRAQ